MFVNWNHSFLEKHMGVWRHYGNRFHNERVAAMWILLAQWLWRLSCRPHLSASFDHIIIHIFYMLNVKDIQPGNSICPGQVYEGLSINYFLQHWCKSNCHVETPATNSCDIVSNADVIDSVTVPQLMLWSLYVVLFCIFYCQLCIYCL